MKYNYNSVSGNYRDIAENEEECAMLSASRPETKEKGLFGNDGSLFWTFFAYTGVVDDYWNKGRCVLKTKRNSLKNDKKSSRGAVSGNRQCGIITYQYFSRTTFSPEFLHYIVSVRNLSGR